MAELKYFGLYHRFERSEADALWSFADFVMFAAKKPGVFPGRMNISGSERLEKDFILVGVHELLPALVGKVESTKRISGSPLFHVGTSHYPISERVAQSEYYYPKDYLNEEKGPLHFGDWFEHKCVQKLLADGRVRFVKSSDDSSPPRQKQLKRLELPEDEEVPISVWLEKLEKALGVK